MLIHLLLAHHSWLEKYETTRQRHNVPTQLAVDALHRLYTVDLAPVVLLRSVGLQLTNAIQPVKVRPINSIIGNRTTIQKVFKINWIYAAKKYIIYEIKLLFRI